MKKLDKYGRLLKSAEETAIFDTDGTLSFQSEQTFDDDFWNDLKDRQDDFDIRLNGYTPVAEVPVPIWNSWIRQGRDPENATSKQIIAWLKAAEASRFLICRDTTF